MIWSKRFKKKTFRFVHFSTFYSILSLFDQIDINCYRLLIIFWIKKTLLTIINVLKSKKTNEQVRALIPIQSKSVQFRIAIYHKCYQASNESCQSSIIKTGTKHIDPDTGLIYFKYDFGYEFGLVLPGEAQKVTNLPIKQSNISIEWFDFDLSRWIRSKLASGRKEPSNCPFFTNTPKNGRLKMHPHRIPFWITK